MVQILPASRVHGGIIALFFGLLLACAAAPAQGQSFPFEAEEVEVEFGVKAGGTSMTWQGDGAPADIDRRTGFQGGALLRIDVPGLISFQPELLFVHKGSSVTDTFLPFLGPDAPEVEVTATRRLSYIELPILVRADLPLTDALLSNLYIGSNVGVNVQADAEIEAEGETETVDISDTISTLDAGIVFGGGLDVDVGARTALLDVRYNLGLSDISEENLSVMNRGLSVALGLRL